MDAAALAIRLWRNEVSVAREHPAPERVRAEVHDLAHSVAADLGAVLGSYLAAQDVAVILVRRLAFDCDIDLASEAGCLARYIARRCAYALVRAIDGGSPDVVRFPSPAAFRARFIADLATGRASDQWYYRAFAGVRVLPSSAAIRTVLLDDVDVGRSTLAAIDDGAWPAVLAALTPREAARIVTGLASSANAMAVDARASWIAATVQRLRSAGSSSSLLALRALALGLRDIDVGERIDAQTAYLTGVIAAAATELSTARLLREVADHGIEALDRFADEAARDSALERAGEGDASCRDAVVRALFKLVPAPAKSAQIADDAIATPYAGYALLVNEIDALLDDTFCAALPCFDDVDARAVAALTALAIAVEPAHATALFRDPAWRTVLAIPPRFEHSVFADALAHDADATAAFDALRERTAGHARGEPVAVAWRYGDERCCARVDMPSRLWLELAIGRAREANEVGRDAVPWRTRLAAARGARRDYGRLVDHAIVDALPVAWRSIFVMLAQVAWRRIAYRVTGLAGASLPYLRANLVAARGMVRPVLPGCWRFEVSRPPLYVLLNLCGFARAELRWSGAAPCTILLDYV